MSGWNGGCVYSTSHCYCNVEFFYAILNRLIKGAGSGGGDQETPLYITLNGRTLIRGLLTYIILYTLVYCISL